MNALRIAIEKKFGVFQPVMDELLKCWEPVGYAKSDLISK